MAKLSLKNIIQHQAYQLVLLQLFGVVILSACALIKVNLFTAQSILLGGLAYILPNLLFVWRVFRHTGANQMAKFMAAFFVGEMTKLFLSAILVLMIVKYLPVSLLSVLIGFIGAIVAFWIACAWRFSKPVVYVRS